LTSPQNTEDNVIAAETGIVASFYSSGYFLPVDHGNPFFRSDCGSPHSLSPGSGVAIVFPRENRISRYSLPSFPYCCPAPHFFLNSLHGFERKKQGILMPGLPDSIYLQFFLLKERDYPEHQFC